MLPRPELDKGDRHEKSQRKFSSVVGSNSLRAGCAADEGFYEVVGTRGKLRMSHAYEYSESVEMEITSGEHTRKKNYKLRDQFGPELIYFSNCILHNIEPEHSGMEGLLDVHVICSLYESAARGVPILLETLHRHRRPGLRQQLHRPVKKPFHKILVRTLHR